MMASESLALELIGKHSFVSRETMTRLSVIVAQIEKWQPHINLVASSTLHQIWNRHIHDSLQLLDIRNDARCWLDLGSGGGFPGLVIAAVLADTPDANVTLVESSAKKCAFLRETSRIAGLPVTVVNQRIEDAVPLLSCAYDVVSARALAPLVTLLDMAEPFLQRGALGIFPKGQDVDGELKTASISWNIGYDLIQSQTEPGAKVVIVKFASRCV
jgi:16S rRNA (guanine527-N7)-methyltransferase